MKKLYRSTSNRMVGGVLGGIGDYFNVDATILRLAFILLLIPSFMTFAVAYLVAMMIVPKDVEIY
ncbi:MULTISPECIES: PspC domain-containing protein [Oceanobacillus]|uniref:PspC domain-containing protein n=1 Tax=Oceanobacillus profundus TaxID=372463 RepID=A0A417YEX1_9BACI|nr:PspC domain-containing protein [Oceanobacillus profundus]MBR3117998.1 PspC domain-containing protein [Oceanobacillus sp.]PAE28598.1 PspC domain-containing protein [Paenibacillus sp. 7884-2]MCM3397278.1 PspC domain-containing protein [Oceanobacillus profundus]MDO6449523.1 PspC domain-containing protein [Oceanobacillus profundus]RHW31235.1 PspC domain-containing protein [Oceanobacillus profundus]